MSEYEYRFSHMTDTPYPEVPIWKTSRPISETSARVGASPVFHVLAVFPSERLLEGAFLTFFLPSLLSSAAVPSSGLSARLSLALIRSRSLVSTISTEGLSSKMTTKVHILPLDSSAEMEQGSVKGSRALTAIMFLFCSMTFAAMLRLLDMSA